MSTDGASPNKDSFMMRWVPNIVMAVGVIGTSVLIRNFLDLSSIVRLLISLTVGLVCAAVATAVVKRIAK